jgi:hypothetical protein
MDVKLPTEDVDDIPVTDISSSGKAVNDPTLDVELNPVG